MMIKRVLRKMGAACFCLAMIGSAHHALERIWAAESRHIIANEIRGMPAIVGQSDKAICCCA